MSVIKLLLNRPILLFFEWNIKENKSFVSQAWNEKFGYNNVCKNIFKEIKDKDLVHSEDNAIFENFLESIKKKNRHNQAVYRLKNLMVNIFGVEHQLQVFIMMKMSF